MLGVSWCIRDLLRAYCFVEPFNVRGMNKFEPELCRAELNDLQASTREGFVVVEWGGMNLNGSAMTR